MTTATKNIVRDNRGFEIIRVSGRSAWEMPSKEIYRNGSIYISKNVIPQTHTYAIYVYFVSGDNGDEFGQFATAEEAISKAKTIA